MAQGTMYPAANGSPRTKVVGALSATATAIPVADASAMPAGPNIATIGDDASAELVLYASVAGGALTGCLRGFHGTTARVWPDGAAVYRGITAYDHDTFAGNIRDLDTGKLGAQGDGSALTAAFTQAATRANVQSGEAQSALWGKVSRWLADLKEGAFAAFGTGNGNMARGDHNHSTLYAALAHAARHASGGADAVTPGAIGAVPVERTVNGKALGANVVLSAADVGAVALANGKASAEAISAGVVQVTTSRALQLSDAGRLLEVAAAGAVVITVPTDAAAAFAVGTEIEILQEGVGGVTVEAAEGVTLHSLDEAREIAGQYGVVALKKRAANDWRLMGALQ